jgi:hypothetical protein
MVKKMNKNEEMYSSWQGDVDSQSEKVKIGQKVEEISLNQLKGFKNHPFKVETNTALFELMQNIIYNTKTGSFEVNSKLSPQGIRNAESRLVNIHSASL